MATTGPALIISFTVGTGQIVGQGDYSIVRCLISTDPVSNSTPTWTDCTSKMREYDVQRGRSTELEEFSAGTATVSLDNRDRAFDPANLLIGPFNRVWLYEEFSGEVHDLFHGYAESWEQAYDKAGVDALATVHASDELIVLAAAALETTDPPRESYADLVMSDQPFGYWDMNEDPAGIAYQPIDTSTPQGPDLGESRGLVEFRRADRRALPGKPRKHG